MVKVLQYESSDQVGRKSKLQSRIWERVPNSIYVGPNVPIPGLPEGQSIHYVGTWILRDY